MFQKLIDEKGMLSILGPLLLVLASTCLLLGYLLYSTKQQTKIRHECRNVALQSQQHLTDGMNAIIQLNPEALRLQAKLRRAELMIRRAVNPKILAIALLNYQNVKIQQKTFRRKQLQIIHSTLIKANSHLQMQAARKQMTTHHRIKFLLKPYPAISDSPIYKDYLGIEKDQIISLSWNTESQINSVKNKFQGECSASITKESEWHPILVAAKEF